jgi:hypothetical protein
MKDILSKLGQLEETFVSETKQVLNESTEVIEKKSSLKDMFESIAGMKPIPVVGKEGGTQQTGAGFVNITDPSLQGLSKTLGDLAAQKKLQIVMPTAGQASGTPAPAGATGQQPAGQQQVKEKWGTPTKIAPSEKGKYAGKTKAELLKSYNALKDSGPHKKGSKEYGRMHELSFAIRAKGDWGKVKEEMVDEKAKNPYAIGMAQAMKSTGGKPPLKKSTVVKAHKIAKKVKEADIPSTQGIDTKGAGLGAGRSQTTLESKKVNEAMNTLEAAFHEGKSHGLGSHAPSCRYNEGSQERHRYFEGYKQGLDECYGMGVYEDAPPATIHGMDDAAMDEGNAFTAALARTPKGGTFKLGGKSFTDHSGYNAVLDEYTFESLDKQLNALLNEGLSVSISKGNPGAPDSVSVSATDQEADSLLAFVKQSGLGISGDDASAPSSYGFPAQGGRSEVNSPGGIEVVDDHDGMMSLMKKLAGVQASAAEDYADEEGECEECGHNPCGCNDEEEMSEETCNECGMLEAQCGCSSGGKEMVDEVESEDQMAYEVAEDNAPDNGSANSMNATKGNDAANMALAVADQKENVAEDDEEDKDEDFFHNPNVPRDQQLKAPPKEINVKESFMDLYKKLAFLSEESTAEKDEKAEKAGKKVAKDIEYDEGHKGKDDNRAEKAGKKVTKDIEYDDKKDKKEKVDEWANKAGPGNTVSDTTFEQDIDFMTKVISGGLNKPKATGQTTVPVIAHQGVRTGIPQDIASDLKKLAGIK